MAGRSRKTYDEMLKLCRQVKEKEPGMGGLTMRGEAGHQVQHAWFNHLTPYGGDVFTDQWEPFSTRADPSRP